MNVPKDVLDFVRGVFSEVNTAIVEAIHRVPAIQEPSLDQQLIGRLATYSEERAFNSGWSISLEAHFIGGMGHLGRREVADIGLLLEYSNNGKVVKTKAAILQSKKLKPKFHPNKLALGTRAVPTTRKGIFRFSGQSRYDAIVNGSPQMKAMIEHYEDYEIPIYYLLYNPENSGRKDIPLPRTKELKIRGRARLGTRVVPMERMHDYLKFTPKGRSPMLRNMRYIIGPNSGEELNYGYRLEYFMADRLLACVDGRELDEDDEKVVRRLFNRESGPLAAIISIGANFSG
jgi:hypothetical protein